MYQKTGTFLSKSNHSNSKKENDKCKLFLLVKFEVYCVYIMTLCYVLVRATVAEKTFRCTIEVIHIERAAVSYLNVGGPVATA